MKQLLIIAAFFIGTIAATAQTTTGQITYSMEFKTDNPEMETGISMMEGSEMNLYFTADKSKVTLAMGAFITINSIYDNTANKGLMLMDLMGSKSATELTSGVNKDETAAIGSKPEITAETKDILGFKCTKNIIRDANGDQSIVWVTTDIKAPLQGQQQFSTTGTVGVPLEFSTTKNGLTIHFTASKFEKNVAMTVFDMKIPEGYKIISEDELKSTEKEG